MKEEKEIVWLLGKQHFLDNELVGQYKEYVLCIDTLYYLE
jgi:hypothetical protein